MIDRDILKIPFKYAKAWYTMDYEIIDEILSDTHFTSIGTVNTEQSENKLSYVDYIKNVLSKRKSMGIQPEEFNESIYNSLYNMKWSYENEGFAYIYHENPNTPFGILRRTYILEKQGDEWKIIHLHSSIPDPLYNYGDYYPSHENMKSELERWIKNFDFNPPLTDELKLAKLKNYLIQASNLLSERS